MPARGRWTAITACRLIARRCRMWAGCCASTRSRPRPRRRPLSVRSIEEFLVDFRRQDKIALGQPVNLVRVGLDVHAAPGERNVRMMSFGFGNRAHTVHEIERRLEIRQTISLGDVVPVDHLPVGQLGRKFPQFFSRKRLDAALAGHAMFSGKAAYSRSTHTCLFLNSTA